jgi:hypothetical protein
MKRVADAPIEKLALRILLIRWNLAVFSGGTLNY